MSFWYYGRDIQPRMHNGFLHHISVAKMHSKKTCKPTGFPRDSIVSSVSEDRKLLHGGGVVVGNLVMFLGVAAVFGW